MASRRQVLALLTLGVMMLLAGCPKNIPTMCGTCNPAFGPENTTAETISEGSELEIQIYANGSSRWTERVRVRGNVSRLNDTETLRSWFSRGRFAPEYAEGPVQISEPIVRFNQTGPETGRLTTTYRASIDTRRVGSYLVVTQFHRDIGRTVRTGTETLVIRAPNGTTVINQPPGGEVNNRSVRFDDTTLSGRTYLVFGPAEPPLSYIGGQLAVAVAVADWAVLAAIVGAIHQFFLIFLLLFDQPRWHFDRPLDRIWRETSKPRLLGIFLAVSVGGSALATIATVVLTVDLLPSLIGATVIVSGLCWRFGRTPAENLRHRTDIWVAVLATSFPISLLQVLHFQLSYGLVWIVTWVWAFITVLLGYGVLYLGEKYPD